MAVPIFLNNVASTIQSGSTAIGSSTATGITVATGDGAKFGTSVAAGTYIPAFVVDRTTNPATIHEYVWITGISGDTLTVVRQAENATGANSYPASTSSVAAGYFIVAAATAAALTQLAGSYFKSITAAYTAVGGDRLLLDPTGINPPTMLTATAAAGGGSFPGGIAYYYAVSAFNAAGQESIVQPTNAYTTPAASGTVNLSWTNPPGTVKNRVYRVNSFSLATPDATAPGLIFTSSSAITSYADTFSVTTPGAAPQSTNGAAFTVTLPDATTVGTKTVTARFVGNSVNLATLATVSSQTIGTDGTSITLGQVYGATALEVTLASDGSNWQYQTVTQVPVQHLHAGNVLNAITVPASSFAAVNILGPVPAIRYGQRAAFRSTVQLTGNAGVSALILTVDWCNSSGVTPSVPGTGNIAFFYDYSVSAGEIITRVYEWLYNPRQGDRQIEGWTDSFNYLRVGVFPVGGSVTNGAVFLDLSMGAVGSSYWPAGS